jgi:hypothetical protein
MRYVYIARCCEEEESLAGYGWLEKRRRMLVSRYSQFQKE